MDKSISANTVDNIHRAEGDNSFHQHAATNFLATEYIIDSPPALMSRVLACLDHPITVSILTLATVYSLFADDFKTLLFPKSSDDIFSSFFVLCMLLFTVEIILSLIYKPEYRFSFYFYLDVIATLSLIPDIGWIWDAAIGISSSSSGGKSLKNARKASKAGTSSTQALRIIRIIRLIRIIKIYKTAKAALENRNKNEEFQELFKDLPMNTESKIGKRVSESIMKKVIIIVLFVLFAVPFFDYEFYEEGPKSWDYGLVTLNIFLNEPCFEDAKNEYLSYHISDIRPIVYLSYSNDTGSFTWSTSDGYAILRFNEIYYVVIDNMISIFDKRYDAKLSALLNIFRTIFVCIILTSASIYFSKDTEELVIKPIEKMILKVNLISKNPINAGDIQSLLLDNYSPADHYPKCEKVCCGSLLSTNYSETQLIDQTIIKIGILLALGFGEAGSFIIGNNIEKVGQLDPLIPGCKVVCIYGFCDIRNFTDTTEELQEGVMMFVNEIAQVVHGIVDKYLGSANKNIGDAFLLIWKFQNDEMVLDTDNSIIKNPEKNRCNYLPDLSLLSFLKILAKVNKDPGMLKYRAHKALVKRMPGYEIKMGFGLHIGWSIEGPIGSQFKIDASYLSLNVNLASALEASTKTYGVPLLISEALYKFFSEPVKGFCRLVDKVAIKGFLGGIRVYTCDCDFQDLEEGKPVQRLKKYYRNKRKKIKKDLESRVINSADLFLASKEFKIMRKGFSQEFYNKFQIGVHSYLQGNWPKAHKVLRKVLLIRNDGPTLAILNYMGELGNIPPYGWEGVRSL